MITGVLFDYGGTLVTTRPDEAILREMLKTLGYDLAIEAVSTAQRSFRAHWDANYSPLPRGKRWTEAVRSDCDRVALRELGLKYDLDRLALHVTRNWDAFSGLQLFADVKPALNALYGLALKMGILSQNLKSSLELRSELQTLGIGKYFAYVLTSEDAGYDKPDPRLYQYASDLMKLKPSELCHVGNDYERDVVGARNARIVPILLDREGQGTHKDCLVIRSLEEIPNLVSRL